MRQIFTASFQFAERLSVCRFIVSLCVCVCVCVCVAERGPLQAGSTSPTPHTLSLVGSLPPTPSHTPARSLELVGSLGSTSNQSRESHWPLEWVCFSNQLDQSGKWLSHRKGPQGPWNQGIRQDGRGIPSLDDLEGPFLSSPQPRLSPESKGSTGPGKCTLEPKPRSLDQCFGIRDPRIPCLSRPEPASKGYAGLLPKSILPRSNTFGAAPISQGESCVSGSVGACW